MSERYSLKIFFAGLKINVIIQNLLLGAEFVFYKQGETGK
jgi:hypothetical protein